jgi:hypothetical protein
MQRNLPNAGLSKRALARASLDLTLVLVLLAPPAFVEWQLAWYVAPAVYTVYAALAIALLYFLLAGTNARLYAWRSWHAQLRVPIAVLLICLVVLQTFTWNSRKAFLREFAKVEIGMSIAEVKEILSMYEASEGRPSATVLQLGYHHDRVSARFDADGALVQFENGRVVLKQFLPD